MCCCIDSPLSYCFTADDLPIRGFIGHLEEGSFLPHNHKTFLWSHLHFHFEYNEDQVSTVMSVKMLVTAPPSLPLPPSPSPFFLPSLQVISANVSTLGMSPLSLDELQPPYKVTYTYSSKWTPTK